MFKIIKEAWQRYKEYKELEKAINSIRVREPKTIPVVSNFNIGEVVGFITTTEETMELIERKEIKKNIILTPMFKTDSKGKYTVISFSLHRKVSYEK